MHISLKLNSNFFQCNLSVVTHYSTVELPLPSPDTNPEEKSEIPHFYNFDILLIYSKLQLNTKYQKFHKSPNLAQLPTPDKKAVIEEKHTK